MDLAKAAAIDASDIKPEIAVPNTIFIGGEVSPVGQKSRYSIKYKEPVNLPNIHEDWNWICRLRVGRALKSIRQAYVLDAAPVAIDKINSEITFALATKSSTFSFSKDSLADFAINAEIVDYNKLESNLLNASWADILKIRKEILPHVQRTKQLLFKRTQDLSNNHYYAIEKYLVAIKDLKNEFKNLQEQEAAAWEGLRIGSILKAGGATGSLAFASIAIPSTLTLPFVITALISAGLIGAAALTPEMQKLIPARRKTREHPLFFLEKLTNIYS